MGRLQGYVIAAPAAALVLAKGKSRDESPPDAPSFDAWIAPQLRQIM